MKRDNLLKKLCENEIKANANSACCLLMYQPKLPKGIEKFKKK